MLKTEIPKFYKVKKGQTLAMIARAFSTTESLLVRENGLTAPIFEGQILKIPRVRGNVYVAKAGESKKLLCGSAENFEKRNGTAVLFPGMRVVL
jgi:hypothetical protein